MCVCVYVQKNRGQLPLFFVEEMSNKFFIQTCSYKKHLETLAFMQY